MPRRPSSNRNYLPKSRRKKPKRKHKVHKTNRWTRLSLKYRQEHPLCEVSKHYGFTVAATETDHIIRIADGGAAYDERNLMSLCKEIHTIKTGWENKDKLNLDFELNENKERIPTDKEQIYKLFEKVFQ